MTLGPLLLIILLGLVYLTVSLTKNKSSKNKAETANRQENVYLVPDRLRGSFTSAELRRFKKLFEACDSNGSGKIDGEELRSIIKKYASTRVDDSEIESYAMGVLAEASNQDAAVVDDTTAVKDISFAQVSLKKM